MSGANLALIVLRMDGSAGWRFRRLPVEGTTEAGWRAVAPSPEPLAGRVPVGLGSAHLAFLGGAGSVPVYHEIVDAWALIPARGVENLRPLAGAAPAPDRAELLGADPGPAAVAVHFPRAIRGLQLIDYTVIGIYCAFMAACGLLFRGKGETSSQFTLGNRDVLWWAAGISMFATGASAISFMAIPATAFATSIIWLLPVFMMIVTYPLQAYVIYPLLRRLELTSTFEYLEHRFHRSLRLFASAQNIVFQTFGRMSVIVVLPALGLSAVTGLDVFLSVLVMGVLTTVYTGLGGFTAVIWTDVFQGVLMIVAPLLIIGFALAGTSGGWDGFVSAGLDYGKFNLAVASWDLALPVFWMMLLGQLINTGGTIGDQPIIQRIFSVPLREVRRTTAMFTVCGVLIAIMTYGMGVALFGFFRSSPESLPVGLSTDQIIPLFIGQHLPVGLTGLVIASIFAASMSTLSSSMNSVATLVCEDFFKPFFPRSTERQRVLLLKVVSYLVGAIGTGVALYMASLNIRSMFEVWNKIVAMLGGGFAGIYLLGVFTRRANAIGAFTGGLASIAVTLVFEQTRLVHWWFYSPFAVVACFVVGYLVSLLTGGCRRNLAGLTAFTMALPAASPATAPDAAPAARP